MLERQLPKDLLKQAVKGIEYIGHPLRLRILEYLDVNGACSVSNIAKGVGEEQLMVSQSLKKLRDAMLVKTERKGIFIFYRLDGEYPASLFNCIRKLFGYLTDSFQFLQDDYKELLPKDFTMMAANQIKMFSHFDKIRILEYLTVCGESCVGDISKGVEIEQVKLSQYLKRMRDDGFIKSRKESRFVYYSITKGVHKTIIKCIHKRFGDE